MIFFRCKAVLPFTFSQQVVSTDASKLNVVCKYSVSSSSADELETVLSEKQDEVDAINVK